MNTTFSIWDLQCVNVIIGLINTAILILCLIGIFVLQVRV
jgi:hypothetical protein